MSLAAMPLAAFDIESTSADPTSARIVSASVCVIDGAQVHTDEWLLDPGIEIPEAAANIHGITTERARAEGEPYEAGYKAIRSRLETLWARDHLVCIMNAAFDLTIIDREGQRLGHHPLVVGPTFDAFVVDRQIDKYRRGKRTLAALCEHYGVRQDDAHQATGDALAAARLAYKLLRSPKLATITDTETLMVSQTAWHRERQTDFIQYRMRNNLPTNDINTEWPVAR